MATVAFPSPSAIPSSPLTAPTAASKVHKKSTSKKAKSSASKTKKENAPDPAKPKQTKSRNGCKNCKEKRLKCDETKPKCNQCQKKGIDCRGYEQVLKWRPQEDTFKNNAYFPKPKKKPPAAKSPPRPPPPLSSSPTREEHAPLPIVNGFATPPPDYDVSENPTLPLDPKLSLQLSSLKSFDKDNTSAVTETCTAQEISSPSNLYSTTSSPVNNNLDTFDDETPPPSAKTEATSLWSGSPHFPEQVIPKLSLTPQDLQDFDGISYDITSELQSQAHLFGHLLAEEDDIEEIAREPEDFSVTPMCPFYGSDYRSTSGAAWIDDFFVRDWDRPRLAPDSQEMLMMHFNSHTCGILSIKDGPTENPWRTLLWPLAPLEPALLYAVNAMTAFHASKKEPSMKPKGVEFYSKSTTLLRKRMNSIRPDIVLSIALVLAFCDSWDRTKVTGRTHITGVKQLLKKLHRSGQSDPEMEERVMFLKRTWVYIDVIARLTSLESDDSEDFDIATVALCEPSGFNHDIDPLMGCANTMFPIIGRVANLIRKVRLSSQNSYKLISQANVLKSQLEKWRAPSIFEEPQDKSTDAEQALRTAESYRWATLLYLHQAVPEISYTDVTEKISQMAREVLTNLANVPETSGATIIHIFPLLAASCEASDTETRNFVKERWHSMMDRMNIGNLDRCWEIVMNVWDRRDSVQKEKQRRRLRATAQDFQSEKLPASILQRKRVIDACMEEEDDDPDRRAGQKRRVVDGFEERSPKCVVFGSGCKASGGLEFDLTVRGRCHWAGVMKDLGWEVLLG